MNAFWMTLLVAAIKAIAGSVVWDAALTAVSSLINSNLSGEEKRKLVLDNLKLAFANVPNSLLNLVIEVAVAKTKQAS